MGSSGREWGNLGIQGEEVNRNKLIGFRDVTREFVVAFQLVLFIALWVRVEQVGEAVVRAEGLATLALDIAQGK